MGFFWSRSKRNTRSENGYRVKPPQAKHLRNIPYTALEVSDSKHVVEEEINKANELTAKRLRLGALVVSWISVIFAFASGVAAIVLGQIYGSESLFGYGLDGVLDSFSSVAVLWRFYGSSSSVMAEARERKACIVISLLFFASAISLGVKSSKAIAQGSKDEEGGRLLTDIFSSCCGVIALVLASSKVYLGRRLDSRSLLTDSVITYVGAAMSFLGVLSLEMYRSDEEIWYLDAVFGLLCGIFLLIFGLKLLIQMTCLYPKRSSPLLEDE